MRFYIKADTVDFSDEDIDDQIAIARDPNTRPERLRDILYANYANLYDKLSLTEAIASNPNTPVDVLVDIAESCKGNSYIEAWLAINPNTPKEISDKLQADYEVRESILFGIVLSDSSGLSNEAIEQLIDKFDFITTLKVAVTYYDYDAVSTVEKIVDLAMSADPAGYNRYLNCNCEYPDTMEEDCYYYNVSVYFTLVLDEHEVERLTAVVTAALEDYEFYVVDSDSEHGLL